jgi:hypothetical protein
VTVDKGKSVLGSLGEQRRQTRTCVHAPLLVALYQRLWEGSGYVLREKLGEHSTVL